MRTRMRMSFGPKVVRWQISLPMKLVRRLYRLAQQSFGPFIARADIRFALLKEDRSFDSDEGVEESGEESADSDIDDSEEVNDAEDEEKAAKADKEADKSNRKKRKSVYVDPAKLPQSKRKAATAAPKSDDESGSDTETKQGVEDAAAAAADGEAEATPKKRGRKPKQPIEPTDAASDGCVRRDPHRT
jgi:hypothetical protein